jgi:hypothetical protein
MSIIWCTAGARIPLTPAIRAIRGLQQDQLPDLLRGQQRDRLDPPGLGRDHPAGELLHPPLGAGDLDPAALDVDIELLVLAHALQRQGRHLLGVVDREDEIGCVSGRAPWVGQRTLVQQGDLGLAELGQVIGDAVADDSRADDHDLLARGQPGF